MDPQKLPRRAGVRQPQLPLVTRLFVVSAGALAIWLSMTALGTVVWGEETPLERHLANALWVFVLACLLVILARLFLDRRTVETLGLIRGRTALRDLLYGALTFLVPAVMGLAVAMAAGWLQITIDATPSESVGALLLVIALVLAYEAVPEELVFRGYIHRNLTAAMAPWLAVLVQALLFTAFGTFLWVVTAGWGVFVERLMLFFGMGVVLGCIRHISGSLWAAIGFHLAFQVVMQAALGGRYLAVSVSNPQVFTIATAVVAFVAATALAGFMWRGEQNWTQPEPDAVPEAAWDG
nr:CPBP family intramembrane metalloprotease [Actinomycetales bacterium]